MANIIPLYIIRSTKKRKANSPHYENTHIYKKNLSEHSSIRKVFIIKPYLLELGEHPLPIPSVCCQLAVTDALGFFATKTHLLVSLVLTI